MGVYSGRGRITPDEVLYTLATTDYDSVVMYYVGSKVSRPCHTDKQYEVGSSFGSIKVTAVFTAHRCL